MKKLAKFLIPTALIALTSSVQLMADACEPPCPPPPCEPCCPPRDPCANCAQLWPTRGPDWIITPNAGPCVSCGVDMFVTAEFIYWTAHEDHLGYVLSTGTNSGSSNQPTATTPDIPGGKVFHPDFKFKPGFKVGLGFLTDHDGWDVYVNYTWLHYNNIKGNASSGDGDNDADDTSVALFDEIVGINGLGGKGGVSNPDTASAKWKLNFNVIDLELGRNFYVSRNLYLRPYVGFKGTWQKQHFDVEMVGTTSFSSGGGGGGNTTVASDGTSTNSVKYWGIGLRSGLDTAWHFTKSFSLVGEAAVSLLWEQFKSHRFDTAAFTPPTGGADLFISNINVSDNFHTINPVFELYMALRWESWFCCDNYHLSIEAGWEEQFWNEQNQFVQIAVETREGDLSLQGFTLKFRFDF